MSSILFHLCLRWSPCIARWPGVFQVDSQHQEKSHVPAQSQEVGSQFHSFTQVLTGYFPFPRLYQLPCHLFISAAWLANLCHLRSELWRDRREAHRVKLHHPLYAAGCNTVHSPFHGLCQIPRKPTPKQLYKIYDIIYICRTYLDGLLSQHRWYCCILMYYIQQSPLNGLFYTPGFYIILRHPWILDGGLAPTSSQKSSFKVYNPTKRNYVWLQGLPRKTQNN